MKKKKTLNKWLSSLPSVLIALFGTIISVQQCNIQHEQKKYEKRTLDLQEKEFIPKFELQRIEDDKHCNYKFILSHGYATNIRVTVLSYLCRGFVFDERIKYIQEGTCNQVAKYSASGFIISLPRRLSEVGNLANDMPSNLKDKKYIEPSIKHIIYIQYDDIDNNHHSIYKQIKEFTDISGYPLTNEVSEELFKTYKSKFFEANYKFLSFDDFSESDFYKYIRSCDISVEDFNDSCFEWIE